MRFSALSIPVAAMAAALAFPTAVLANHHGGSDDIVAHLRALEQLQNDRANGVEGTADGPNMIADDVMIVMSQGEPMTGMPPQMAALMADERFKIHTTPIAAWVAESGELAVTTADVEIESPTPDGTINHMRGTRQFVWQKNGDGEWKIVTVFNAGARPAE